MPGRSWTAARGLDWQGGYCSHSSAPIPFPEQRRGPLLGRRVSGRGPLLLGSAENVGCIFYLGFVERWGRSQKKCQLVIDSAFSAEKNSKNSVWSRSAITSELLAAPLG